MVQSQRNLESWTIWPKNYKNGDRLLQNSYVLLVDIVTYPLTTLQSIKGIVLVPWSESIGN